MTFGCRGLLFLRTIGLGATLLASPVAQAFAVADLHAGQIGPEPATFAGRPFPYGFVRQRPEKLTRCRFHWTHRGRRARVCGYATSSGPEAETGTQRFGPTRGHSSFGPQSLQG